VAASVVAHVKAGRLRGLGVTTPQPLAALPDLPAIAQAGLPGYEAVQHSGLFAPAKTPPAVIDTLYREIARVLGQSETRERLTSLGVDVVAGSPAAFAAKMRSEIEIMGKVIRDAGIRAD
jgi:tripartite-type tricarboxylate transporter receptor subunit TctC